MTEHLNPGFHWQGRRPTRGKKILHALEQAGADGMTTIALSKLLYNDIGYPAQGRAKCLIQNLRKQGHKILMIRDEGYQSGRYVLEEQNGQEPLSEILRLLTAALADTNHAYTSEQLAMILTELLAAPGTKKKIAETLMPFIEAWLRDAA